MKVLFIGGTGIISSACSELAISQGVDLWLLNRGQSVRPIPKGAQSLVADINENPQSVKDIIKDHKFDVIVNWIVFTPDQIKRDIELFKGKTGQYIFISSASVYQTPLMTLPITESTPLYNPVWEYSRNKIACENVLMEEYRSTGFPITIVRPSHTYDKTLFPMRNGWTVLNRMRHGKKVIVHGDGTSLWVLTHHRDFAKGFNGLLGHPRAIGEAFHITSDEVLTWNYIFDTVAKAGNTVANKLHIPSEIIAQYDADMGASLLGDKCHSVIFDNSKIKSIVPDFNCTIPFHKGIQEVIEWYENHTEKEKFYNKNFDKMLNQLVKTWDIERGDSKHL